MEKNKDLKILVFFNSLPLWLKIVIPCVIIVIVFFIMIFVNDAKGDIDSNNDNDIINSMIVPEVVEEDLKVDIDEQKVEPTASSNVPIVPDSEDIIFIADEGVRLINLWKPENSDYKEWWDNKLSGWLENRPEKFYLSEYKYILEEDDKLYYANEQTREKKLILEGEMREDPWVDTNVVEIRFIEKINENKFVYQKYFDQWNEGCGIYDISDFSSHPIPSFESQGIFFGLYGEYIYTALSPNFLITNVNTYETNIILPDLPKEYRHFHGGDFSPDGKLYMVSEPVFEEYSDYNKIRKGTDVKIYDIESQKLLATFNIYTEPEDFFDSYYSTSFIDNNIIYIYSNKLTPPKYLVEIDLTSQRENS